MSGGLQLTMIRRGESLVPAAPMFLEDMQSIPEGRAITVTTKRSRSTKHHRRFFAKLRKLKQSGVWDNDEDSLLEFIKIAIGHMIPVIDNSSTMVSGTMLAMAEAIVAKYDPATDENRLARFVISMAGPKTYLVPKSISFEALGQDEFNDIERRADKFIAGHFGVDPEELMREAIDMAATPADLETDEPDEPAPADEMADVQTESLEKRLDDFAGELGWSSSPEDVEKLWAQMKTRPEVKALHKLAPDTLKALVEACRNHARGKLTDELFNNAVDAAIAKAVAEREAA